MDTENLSSIGATIGGGFFGGILIGYALKKVVKIVAVVVGLFFAGLAYLRYQQIIDIKWAKLQAVSQSAFTALANASTQIPGFSGGEHAAALSNLGIPLTGSMSMGIVIGFMRGWNKVRFPGLLSKLLRTQSDTLLDDIIGYEHIKRLFRFSSSYSSGRSTGISQDHVSYIINASAQELGLYGWDRFYLSWDD